MNMILDFFIDNFPSARALLTGGPLSLLWAFSCLFFAGYLKKTKHLKTGYSRKIFHFLIFMTAAFVNWQWGLPGVCLFGGMTSLVVFYAILRGEGNMLYEAMAREKDAPHRTFYIITPYFATLIGGVASNILFGSLAVIGYLVTGIGDAIGEPVGTRFGKHQYRVPSLRNVKSTRSYEGSGAVFIVSFLAILAGITLVPELKLDATSILLALPVAIGCMLVEAVSPHGWDNATMQIIPPLLISLFIL